VNASLLEERNAWIAKLVDSGGQGDKVAKSVSVKRHDELLSKRLAEGDPENVALIRQAEAAFLVYRNAEISFARAAFASRGVAAVENAAFIHATDTWTDVLSNIHGM
jgi:hypothetical protein